MAWKANKRLAGDFPDLLYLPTGRCEWVPQQQPPVRCDDARDYATLAQFCEHCLDDLLADLGPVTALEVSSTLYALIEPWDALEHDAVFDLLDRRCVDHRRAARLRTFRPRQE